MQSHIFKAINEGESWEASINLHSFFYLSTWTNQEISFDGNKLEEIAHRNLVIVLKLIWSCFVKFICFAFFSRSYHQKDWNSFFYSIWLKNDTHLLTKIQKADLVDIIQLQKTKPNLQITHFSPFKLFTFFALKLIQRVNMWNIGSCQKEIKKLKYL